MLSFSPNNFDENLSDHLPESVLTEHETYTKLEVLGLQPVDQPMILKSTEVSSKPLHTIFERLLKSEESYEKTLILSPIFDMETNYDILVAKLKGHLVGSVPGRNFILDMVYKFDGIGHRVETLVHLRGKKIVVLNIVPNLPDNIRLHHLDTEHFITRNLKPFLSDPLDSYDIEVFHVIFKPNEFWVPSEGKTTYVTLSCGFTSTSRQNTLSSKVYVTKNPGKLPAFEKHPTYLQPEVQLIFVDHKNFLLPHIQGSVENEENDEISGEINLISLNPKDISTNDETFAPFYIAAFTGFVFLNLIDPSSIFNLHLKHTFVFVAGHLR